jgi:hypothetical protein
MEPFQLAHDHVDYVQNDELKVVEVLADIRDRIPRRCSRQKWDPVANDLKIEFPSLVKGRSSPRDLEKLLLDRSAHLCGLEEVAILRTSLVVRLHDQRATADEG